MLYLIPIANGGGNPLLFESSVIYLQWIQVNSQACTCIKLCRLVKVLLQLMIVCLCSSVIQ